MNKRIAAYISSKPDTPSFIASSFANAKTAAEARWGEGIEWETLTGNVVLGQKPDWDDDTYIMLKLHVELENYWAIGAVADRVVTEELLEQLLADEEGTAIYEAAYQELLKMPAKGLLALMDTETLTAEEVIGELRTLIHTRATTVTNEIRANLFRGMDALN